jgi:hypothetical protein
MQPAVTAASHPATMNTNTSIRDQEEKENIEVQRFFGWASKEELDMWKGKLKKAIDDDAPLEEESELRANLNFVKNMRLLHGEALADEEYMANFYPVFFRLYNIGGLCLVLKEYFSVAKTLLRIIVKEFKMDELQKGNSSLVKDTFDNLMGDVEVQKSFLECSTQMSGMSEAMKTKIWRHLVSKTYHAWTGVITDRFGDDTTGHYSAKTRNNSLWLELKIKSRAKSIMRVESALSKVPRKSK